MHCEFQPFCPVLRPLPELTINNHGFGSAVPVRSRQEIPGDQAANDHVQDGDRAAVQAINDGDCYLAASFGPTGP
jgi:hypothetical protein